MRRNIPLLKTSLLYEQLRECEAYHSLTPSERAGLLLWLKQGNDFNSNPWGYHYGDGWQMDYITALMLDIETYETMKRVAEES